MYNLLNIILIVYILAINFYGAIMLNYQRKSFEDYNKDAPSNPKPKKISDFRLFLIGLLGGAMGIFTCMLIEKYRLKNFFLMIIFPLLIVLNIYLIICVLNGAFFPNTTRL